MAASAQREFSVRLGLDGSGRVKSEFDAIGRTGKKALDKIERATKPAGAGLRLVDKTAKGAAGGMKNLATAITVVDGPLGGVAGRFNVLSSTMGRVGLVGVGLVVTIGALIAGFKALVGAGEELERSTFRVEALLRSTGNAAGVTSGQITSFAKELGRETLASAEDVRKASGVLLTFKSVAGDAFFRTLTVAQDLSAVLGTDLSSTVVQLGKALEDPETGLTSLRRVGVSFTEQQKEMIKALNEAGKAAEAQATILGVLEGQVGGAGAGEAGGLTGSVDNLAESWTTLTENMNESVGAAENWKSVIDAISGIFDDINEDFTLKGQIAAANGELKEMAKRLSELQDIRAKQEASPIFIGLSVQPEIDALKKQIELRKETIQDINDEIEAEELFATLIQISSQEQAAFNEKQRLATIARKQDDTFDKILADLERQADLADLSKETREQELALDKARAKVGRELVAGEKEQLIAAVERRQSKEAEIKAERDRLKDQAAAEKKAERERKKAADKALRERQKAQEKAAKAAAHVWLVASENVQEALADTFVKVTEDGLDSFGDFFNSLVDLAKRAAAEMAAAMIITPIFGGFISAASGGAVGGAAAGSFGGSALGGAVGFSALTSSISLAIGKGFANIAGRLGFGAGGQAAAGNAGLRFGSPSGLAGGLLGGIGANLVFGGGTGTTIGSALGGIAGSFIPVPFLGPLIGSFLGGAIGSLFGGGKSKVALRSGPGAFEDGVSSTGAFGTVGLDDALSKRVNATFARGLTDMIVGIDNALASILSPEDIGLASAALEGTGVRVKFKKFDDELFDIVKDRVGTVLDAVIGAGASSRILGGIAKSEDNVEQLVEAAAEALNFATNFDDTIAALEGGQTDLENIQLSARRQAEQEIGLITQQIRDFKEKTAAVFGSGAAAPGVPGAAGEFFGVPGLGRFPIPGGAGIPGAPGAAGVGAPPPEIQAAADATRAFVENMLGISEVDPQPLTAAQVALEILEGRFDALGPLLDEVGIGAEQAGELFDRARQDLADAVAVGLGRRRDRALSPFINTIKDLDAQFALAAADAEALGNDMDQVIGTFGAELGNVLDRLSAEQLQLVIDRFADLEDGLEIAAAAAERLAAIEAEAAEARLAGRLALEVSFGDRLLAIEDNNLDLALAQFDRSAAEQLAQAENLGADITLFERILAAERLAIVEEFEAEAAATEAAAAAEAAAHNADRLALDVSFGDRLLAVEGKNLDLALAQFDRAAEAQLKEAEDLGADITLLERVLAGERLAIMSEFEADARALASQSVADQVSILEDQARAARSAAEALARTRDTLGSFRANLILDSNLSAVSARDRLAFAETRFEDLASSIFDNGNLARLDDLPELGRALVEVARENHASTPRFAAIFNRVIGTVEAAEDLAASRIPTEERLAGLAEQQVGVLEQIRAILEDPNSGAGAETAAEIVALRQQDGSNAEIMQGQLDALREILENLTSAMERVAAAGNTNTGTDG